MNTVLYAVIVCLLLIVAYLAYRHIDVMKREKGLDQIEEGYQADIMDLEDRIESLTATVHQVSNRGLHERTNLRNQLADETQAKDDALTERAQALETVEELEQELTTKANQLVAYQESTNEKQMLLDAVTEELHNVRAQLADVQQTALEMQIELTVPEAKTPETIFRETHEALNKQGIDFGTQES